MQRENDPLPLSRSKSSKSDIPFKNVSVPLDTLSFGGDLLHVPTIFPAKSKFSTCKVPPVGLDASLTLISTAPSPTWGDLCRSSPRLATSAVRQLKS